MNMYEVKHVSGELLGHYEADDDAKFDAIDPQGILLEAVIEIGIECRGFMFSGRGIFPQKHSLSVVPGKISPKEGYGNWTDNIIIQPKPRGKNEKEEEN